MGAAALAGEVAVAVATSGTGMDVPAGALTGAAALADEVAVAGAAMLAGEVAPA